MGSDPKKAKLVELKEVFEVKIIGLTPKRLGNDDVRKGMRECHSFNVTFSVPDNKSTGGTVSIACEDKDKLEEEKKKIMEKIEGCDFDDYSYTIDFDDEHPATRIKPVKLNILTSQWFLDIVKNCSHCCVSYDKQSVDYNALGTMSMIFMVREEAESVKDQLMDSIWIQDCSVNIEKTFIIQESECNETSDHWTCPSCTYINNITVDICEMCETHSGSESGSADQWACKECTYFNANSRECCEICESPKSTKDHRKKATNSGAASNATTNSGAVSNAATNTGSVSNAATNTGSVSNAATNTGSVSNAATNMGSVSNAATNTGSVSNAATNTGSVSNAATNTGSVSNAPTNSGAAQKTAVMGSSKDSKKK